MHFQNAAQDISSFIWLIQVYTARTLYSMPGLWIPCGFLHLTLWRNFECQFTGFCVLLHRTVRCPCDHFVTTWDLPTIARWMWETGQDTGLCYSYYRIHTSSASHWICCAHNLPSVSAETWNFSATILPGQPHSIVSFYAIYVKLSLCTIIDWIIYISYIIHIIFVIWWWRFMVL